MVQLELRCDSRSLDTDQMACQSAERMTWPGRWHISIPTAYQTLKATDPTGRPLRDQAFAQAVQDKPSHQFECKEVDWVVVCGHIACPSSFD